MNHKQNKEYWQTVWMSFKNGDRRAFEIIYNYFVDVLYAYGSKMTSDKSLLEDAIQDVFIDAYVYGKSLRQPEYLEFYLFKILKHNIIRKYKENNRFILDEDPVTHFDFKFIIEEIEKDEFEIEKPFLLLLQQEIKKLNAQKRELLFLRFHSGLTYIEIGKLLHLNPDTAKKQVQRLLKLLRKKFEKSSLNYH